MIYCLMVSMMLSVNIPSSSDIPTVTAEDNIRLDLSGGSQWIRLLEDDYVCLRITCPEGLSMKAWDENGELLCQSLTVSGRQEMILSAFRDYWFFIQVLRDSDGAPLEAEVNIREVAAKEIDETSRREDGLARSEMARVWTFSPESEGNWTFRLEGTGGTDLDLDVYGPNMDLWGSSMSLEGFETVTVPVLPNETITALVSRYGKSGTGDYMFSVEPSGRFPAFETGGVETSVNPGEIHRYLLPSDAAGRFLDLALHSPGTDLDLVVRDRSGDYVMGSQSYASIETLLLTDSASACYVAEVLPFDTGEEESAAYTLTLREPGGLYTSVPVKEVLPLGTGRSLPVGFAPGQSGLVRVSASFEKTRNGDVRVFRGAGEPAATFASARGVEEFLLHVNQGDTVWIDPFYSNIETEGPATVRISQTDAPQVQGSFSGEISGSSPTAFFVTRAEPETILDIKLSGGDREVDLDLFVSGPGVDLVAEGWLSNTDAAGDEAIEVYADKSADYGVTVYLYEREGETSYVLETASIERVPLAESSPDPETWAVVAGISGYSDAADILNRASMDAVEVYDFLVEEQSVPQDHVVLLVDALATEDNFLQSLVSVLKKAGAEDRIVVFYSGHGVQSYPGSGGPEEEDSANEYICLYDNDVSDDRMASLVDSLAEAPVFLFLDACHSGGFTNDFQAGDNVLVLSAAREDLSVSERILTPILLRGSRGDADGDGNGYVSGLELMEYVDLQLQLICPECDAELQPGTFECPECGAVLKGDNAVPRPQQGNFLLEDVLLWTAPED